jgi:peptidoglycan/xylan/chitin deacetylase (PgdA/CDA1 family)
MTPIPRLPFPVSRLWAGAAGLGLLGVLAAEVLGRGAGWGALGTGDRRVPQVALTFDDGPSPHTPELLAVLARYGAQATFFVTESAVRTYPDHLRAIQDAGHQTEAHGRWHRPALLLPPWQEWAQIAWRPPGGGRLYRPPYGGHSPFTRLLAAVLGRRVTLWDAESRDWTAPGWTPAAGPQAPEALARRTLEQVQAGSVVLLHDGPAVTSALLAHLLAGLDERGLRAVRADALPLRRISLSAGLRRLRRSYGG